MVIIAHRGFHDGRRVAPNSIGAFRRAVELGAAAVELDVRRTVDGVVIVHHDRSPMPRVTKTNRIHQLTVETVRRLHLEYHGAESGPDSVPTLDEAIDALGPEMTLHVELKSEAMRTDGLEAAVLEVLTRRQCLGRSVLSTFNPFTLRRVRRLAPDVRTALLFHGRQSRPFRKAWAATALKPYAVHPEHPMVDEANLEKWRENGYVVNVWTVNDRTEMRRMARLGVNGLITDRPDVALDLFGK